MRTTTWYQCDFCAFETTVPEQMQEHEEKRNKHTDWAVVEVGCPTEGGQVPQEVFLRGPDKKIRRFRWGG